MDVKHWWDLGVILSDGEMKSSNDNKLHNKAKPKFVILDENIQKQRMALKYESKTRTNVSKEDILSLDNDIALASK